MILALNKVCSANADCSSAAAVLLAGLADSCTAPPSNFGPFSDSWWQLFAQLQLTFTRCSPACISYMLVCLVRACLESRGAAAAAAEACAARGLGGRAAATHPRAAHVAPAPHGGQPGDASGGCCQSLCMITCTGLMISPACQERP